MTYMCELRKDYNTRSQLLEQDISSDPFLQFCTWFKDALKSEHPDANSMILSTVDNNLQPYSRTVLLKNYAQGQFTFFTNLKSKKAIQILTNPKVSLLFYWKTRLQQIHINGTAVLSSESLSDSYFSSRPRDSQIGAWASKQSIPISNRKELENNFEKQKDKFQNKKIPRPDFWGGITITAQSYEFWQGRENRLHDRIHYNILDSKKIIIKRLSP
jgi:pyridoxamine 5'-phosphate oxidase